jgi:hypothetical protein
VPKYALVSTLLYTGKITNLAVLVVSLTFWTVAADDLDSDDLDSDGIDGEGMEAQPPSASNIVSIYPRYNRLRRERHELSLSAHAD